MNAYIKNLQEKNIDKQKKITELEIKGNSIEEMALENKIEFTGLEVYNNEKLTVKMNRICSHLKIAVTSIICEVAVLRNKKTKGTSLLWNSNQSQQLIKLSEIKEDNVLTV